MKTDMSFLAEAVHVLHEKGYSKESYPLHSLAETVESNHKNARSKVFMYKWSGFFLLTAVPLISAFLTIGLSNDKTSSLQWITETAVLTLSFILTLLTVLNAIFRPGERFYQVCLIGINIETFKSDFLTDLTQLKVVDDVILAKFIQEKRKAFEGYQEKLIGLFMPMEKK